MFQKQFMMRRVIYSLVPVYLFAAYLYGLRLLMLTVVVFGAAIMTEFIMEKRKNKKVSEAVLVTAMLFLLSLPPRTPWWIALIGIIFAVLFTKEVFGGFGKNIFNPAIAGRLFIYITFPGHLTYDWQAIGSHFGLGADALSGATPMGVLRTGEGINLVNSLLGLRPGSMGESPLILIMLAAAYLIWTKTASWKIIISTLFSGLALAAALDLAGVARALPFVPSMLSGSFIFVAVFMATDPISAPKKEASKWIFGLIIGVTTVLVRSFSLFPEGTSFGIMIGNCCAPLLDELFSKRG